MKKSQKMRKTDGKIRRKYYDPQHKVSFGGKTELIKTMKQQGVSKENVTNWLQSQEAYTLHKPVRRKFPRRQTLVDGLHEQFQADLIDMQKFSLQNYGHKFILTIIDVFSKFAWTRPLNSYSGQVVASS